MNNNNLLGDTLRPNVLMHLSEDENSITKLLRALCALKPFRDIIVHIFTQNKYNASSVDFEDISIQVSIDGVIPDFAILREDLKVIVEIKTSEWRKFTDNQPEQYLEWLQNRNQEKGNKFFVLLVPPNYYEWETYNNRKKDFVEKYPQHGIIFTEINWIDIANELKKICLPDISVYIQDFYDLLQNLYIPKPLNFSLDEIEEENMYSKKAYTAIFKIITFIDQIALEIEQAGFKFNEAKNKRWWEEDGEYAIKIKHQEREILYIGIWSLYWKEQGYPLCIAVDSSWDTSLVERFRNAFPNSKPFPPNDKSPWWTYPIEDKLLREDSVKNVAKMLLQGYLNLNDISYLFTKIQANK